MNASKNKIYHIKGRESFEHFSKIRERYGNVTAAFLGIEGMHWYTGKMKYIPKKS